MLPLVPYPDRRSEQSGGLTLRGHCSLTREGGAHAARGARDCQHHGGRELGRDGMANRGEPLLNVVMHDKPKVLRGLTQKGCGPDRGLLFPPTQTTRPPADRRSLPHQGADVERGKPVDLPRGTAAREGRLWACG